MDYNDRESIKYYIDRLRDTLSHAEEAYKQDDIEKMTTLRDWLPEEYFAEHQNDRVNRLLDVEVEVAYRASDDNVPEYDPFKEAYVFNWCVLKSGHAVGWNENPSHGWSFPVRTRWTRKYKIKED